MAPTTDPHHPRKPSALLQTIVNFLFTSLRRPKCIDSWCDERNCLAKHFTSASVAASVQGEFQSRWEPLALRHPSDLGGVGVQEPTVTVGRNLCTESLALALPPT